MDLEDRMKLYESASTTRFMPLLPICVRLDGKGFHKWTRGLERPFDARLHAAFDAVTIALIREANARIGYTQSDEITLVIYSPDYRSQTYFDGKSHKIVSVLASTATALFREHFAERPPAIFDCRAWTVPSLEEAANVLLWREMDAIRNSIQATAQAHFSPRQLHKKHAQDMKTMLLGVGINWAEFPDRQKKGAAFARQAVLKELPPDVLEKIPPGRRPSGPILRQDVAPLCAAPGEVFRWREILLGDAT